MSYMGEYVLWLEENGYEPTMDRVKQYHKENPHMIPKPRDKFAIQQRDNFVNMMKIKKQ